MTGEWVAQEVELAFGGVAAKTISAPTAAAKLQGVAWNQRALSAALEALAEDVNITADAPGASLPSPFFSEGVCLRLPLLTLLSFTRVALAA